MYILSFCIEPIIERVFQGNAWIRFQAFVTDFVAYPFLVKPQEMFLVASRRQQLLQIEQGSGGQKPSTQVYVWIQLCTESVLMLRHMERNAFANRQMRGEELRGLDIEELQQLERSLEVGLSRVIEKKVSIYPSVFCSLF